jgi:hypothetical protein
MRVAASECACTGAFAPAFAKPKSTSFEPAFVIMTFDGFTSR